MSCFLLDAVSVLSCREGDAEENLGSPGDPGSSLACWSISGKYLAGALEKMVNIWQVNGTNHIGLNISHF